MIVNYRTGKVTNLKEVFPYTHTHTQIGTLMCECAFRILYAYACVLLVCCIRFYLFLCVIGSAYWLSERFENKYCFHCPWKWLKTRVHASILYFEPILLFILSIIYRIHIELYTLCVHVCMCVCACFTLKYFWIPISFQSLLSLVDGS